MSELSIRRAVKDDAPVILAQLRELAVYEKAADKFHLTEALIVRDMLGENAAAHCDIAFFDGEAVGLAVWYWIYKSFRARRGLFVEDLYVCPGFRGRGIGKALLAHLAGGAAEAGAGWMEWVVLNWNAPAIDFYTRIGARPVTDWLTYRLESDAMKRLGTA